MKLQFHILASIALLSALEVNAAVAFYLNNSSGFSGAMTTYQFVGIENFEEGVDQGGATNLTSPLQQGVSNSAAFPTGINESITVAAPSSLIFGSATSNPWGLGTSIVITGGFPISYLFESSDQITGIGFNLYQFYAPGTATVAVYNQNDNLLGTISMPGNSTGSNFLGIATSNGDFIGRITVGDQFLWTGSNNGGADNIQIYSAIPEASTMLLLSLGSLGLTFLRRVKR